MYRMGLSAKGKAVGEWRRNAKLTAEQVAEMRHIRETTGLYYKKLGAMFGVSDQNAWQICKGKIWNVEAVRFVDGATSDESDKVAALAEQGLGHKAIAAALGVTRYSAYRILRDIRTKALKDQQNANSSKL